MDYKKLWINLLNWFENTGQTNWGKTQIVEIMKQWELDMARRGIKDEGK